ncbi:unnamed protein product [Prorocentrum cordatum]|uniref:Uncharacterized protein n=2 Tax=Prorocentrum cordatum TaxID=2364126 RepID=A0ABN9RNV1_9DINO|nr:unnamed protein product [Polarella glacialis]
MRQAMPLKLECSRAGQIGTPGGAMPRQWADPWLQRSLGHLGCPPEPATGLFSASAEDQRSSRAASRRFVPRTAGAGGNTGAERVLGTWAPCSPHQARPASLGPRARVRWRCRLQVYVFALSVAPGTASTSSGPRSLAVASPRLLDRSGFAPTPPTKRWMHLVVRICVPRLLPARETFTACRRRTQICTCSGYLIGLPGSEADAVHKGSCARGRPTRGTSRTAKLTCKMMYPTTGLLTQRDRATSIRAIAAHVLLVLPVERWPTAVSDLAVACQ